MVGFASNDDKITTLSNNILGSKVVDDDYFLESYSDASEGEDLATIIIIIIIIDNRGLNAR